MTREQLEAKILEYQQLARQHSEQAQMHAEQAQRAIGAVAALTDVLNGLPPESVEHGD